MFSSCHNIDMGDNDMQMCPTCGKWFKKGEDKEKEQLLESTADLTTFSKEQLVSREYIDALVLSPMSSGLERKPLDYLYKLVSSKDSSTMTIQPEQLVTLVVNRLNRLAKNGEKNLVPVYDNQGNMLWPEKIPYIKLNEKFYGKL